MKTQQDHLVSKYLGTGSADSSKHEMMEHQHRDTYAYAVSNEDMLLYMR